MSLACYPTGPVARKLGLLHCSRRTVLFLVKESEGKAAEIRPNVPVFNYRGIVSSPDKTVLSAAKSAAHYSCHRLCVAPANDPSDVRVVVEVVREAGDFPGLYPTFKGSKDLSWVTNDTLLVQSNCRSSCVLYLVEVLTGKIRRVVKEYGTWTVLASHGAAVVASFSTHILPNVVYFTENVTKEPVEWVEVCPTVVSPVLH